MLILDILFALLLFLFLRYKIHLNNNEKLLFELTKKENKIIELGRRDNDWFRIISESLPQLMWTCRSDGPCDRKTWYGTHSEQGAETAAILFSIVETCKLNGVNPREYFPALIKDLLDGKKPYTPDDFKLKS